MCYNNNVRKGRKNPMADRNQKFFIHTETGEVVMRKTKLGAYAYFKRDGKRCGYTTNRKQVMSLRKFVAENS